MPARLRVRRRQCKGQAVVVLQGEVDGSTACRALNVLARATLGAGEILLDLSALTAVDPFGLEVFARGLRQLARDRRVRIQGSPVLLPVLTALAQSLLARHST